MIDCCLDIEGNVFGTDDLFSSDDLFSDDSNSGFDDFGWSE